MSPFRTANPFAGLFAGMPMPVGPPPVGLPPFPFPPMPMHQAQQQQAAAASASASTTEAGTSSSTTTTSTSTSSSGKCFNLTRTVLFGGLYKKFFRDCVSQGRNYVDKCNSSLQEHLWQSLHLLWLLPLCTEHHEIVCGLPSTSALKFWTLYWK